MQIRAVFPVKGTQCTVEVGGGETVRTLTEAVCGALLQTAADDSIHHELILDGAALARHESVKVCETPLSPGQLVELREKEVSPSGVRLCDHSFEHIENYNFKYTESVKCMDLSECEKYLVCTLYEAPSGGRVTVWELHSGLLKFVLEPQGETTFYHKAKIAKKYIFAASDLAVDVFSLDDGTHLKRMPEIRGSTLEVTPLFLVASSSTEIIQYEISTILEDPVFPKFTYPKASLVRVARDSSLLLSLYTKQTSHQKEGRLALYGLHSGVVQRELRYPSLVFYPCAMCFSRCSKYIVTACGASTALEVRDATTLEVTFVLKGVWGEVDHLACGGGRTSAKVFAKSTASTDPVQVWELFSGKYLGEVAVSEDGLSPKKKVSFRMGSASPEKAADGMALVSCVSSPGSPASPASPVTPQTRFRSEETKATQIGCSFLLAANDVFLYDVSGGWNARKLAVRKSSMVEAVPDYIELSLADPPCIVLNPPPKRRKNPENPEKKKKKVDEKKDLARRNREEALLEKVREEYGVPNPMFDFS